MTIYCTGSIAYDYLMTFPGYFQEHILPEKINTISLSFLVDSMVRHQGGTAANIAYTLALLGGRPAVAAAVGQDFGDYREWLESKGVDTRWVKVIEDDFTASFFVNTDRANAQIASFYPGAMARAAMVSVKDFVDPELVVIAPDDPAAMDQHVRECIELGVPYLYDPSQQVVRMDPAEIARGISGAQSLFVNEYEFELVQKHTHQTEQQLIDQTEFMVITLGERGACIYADGKQIWIPIVAPEMMVDPTGVGDAFRGGFLRGRQLGLDWEICGRMGALAGTYCLEQRGTQNHAYSLAQFISRYRQSFDDQGALDVLLHLS